MVGVPGRSKGCKTCRKRKVAVSLWQFPVSIFVADLEQCTLEKPICGVCARSNRECGGYQRDIIFVFDARTKKESPPPKSSSPAESSRKVSPSNENNMMVPKGFQTTISTVDPSASRHPRMLPSPSTRTIYRNQVISEFVTMLLPSAFSMNWLLFLPSYQHFTPALETAALAVCIAQIGHMNASPSLARESLKLYVQGLGELQKALWSEDLMYSDETLAACMLLLPYEMRQRPEQTAGAWIGHMDGCAKLIESRGPDSFNTEFGHELFSGFRQVEAS
jgi:hypothetical protein